MDRLRVSAISFLNTVPLMWDFDHGELRREFRVDYTIPSACAEALRLGEADIGIVPVAAYASIPDLVVIPDIAIAARGPVRSIRLFCKVPLEEIKTVAADTSSRSSVALLKVLFSEFYGLEPEFVPMTPALQPMLQRCDAALVIGDPALLAQGTTEYLWDLAEEWVKFTGKPFVFAFWAVRKKALRSEQEARRVVEAFQTSRDHGLEAENLETSAREWSNRLGLKPEEIVQYLTENIYYRLDSECQQGMDLFFRMAAQGGILPQAPQIEYLK
jgi:chorismate dehydratase